MEWFIIIVVVGVIAFFGGRYALRRRYIGELTARGWTFVEHPDISIAHGLNNPPFGHGFQRWVDDQIVGRSSSGVSFQAFKYGSSDRTEPGYVVAMRLERSLPEFYAFPEARRRSYIQGSVIADNPFLVVTSDIEYGRAVNTAIGAELTRMATSYPVDLSIDHDQLVALGADRNPAHLAGFVDALADVHAALRRADLSRWQGEPTLDHLSFYRRPHWHYLRRDDSFLSVVNHTRSGTSHEARDVVYSDNFGLPFVAMVHYYETETTSTDADGGTTTTTHSHTEPLLEYRIPFAFRPICFDVGRGSRVLFESEEFNRNHRVRASVARFASDVFHPRQIEYVLRTKPYPFEVLPDNRIIVNVPATTPDVLDFMAAFFHGFFGRIPDFTYRELGAWPRPIPEVSDYNA